MSTPHRFTAEEVEALRLRVHRLTRELADVFDAIAAKVRALNEELEGGDAGALAEVQAYRHVDRPTGG